MLTPDTVIPRTFPWPVLAKMQSWGSQPMGCLFNLEWCGKQVLTSVCVCFVCRWKADNNWCIISGPGKSWKYVVITLTVAENSVKLFVGTVCVCVGTKVQYAEGTVDRHGVYDVRLLQHPRLLADPRSLLHHPVHHHHEKADSCMYAWRCSRIYGRNFLCIVQFHSSSCKIFPASFDHVLNCMEHSAWGITVI